MVGTGILSNNTRSPYPEFNRHSGLCPSTVTPSIDQALHQFLTLLLIWTLLPNLSFYLIARGFHRTFATGAVCQQRTLTPKDTLSCPTLGLASVLMLNQSLLNLSCFRTFEFRTSLDTSVFAPSVISSQIGVLSDRLRVSLYMVMSQNVM